MHWGASLLRKLAEMRAYRRHRLTHLVSLLQNIQDVVFGEPWPSSTAAAGYAADRCSRLNRARGNGLVGELSGRYRCDAVREVTRRKVLEICRDDRVCARGLSRGHYVFVVGVRKPVAAFEPFPTRNYCVAKCAAHSVDQMSSPGIRVRTRNASLPEFCRFVKLEFGNNRFAPHRPVESFDCERQ